MRPRAIRHKINLAGAAPIAIKDDEKDFQGCNLSVIAEKIAEISVTQIRKRIL